MRLVFMIAVIVLAAGAGQAQELNPNDLLSRACRLVATNLIERHETSELTSFRVHRMVTVKWTSSDLGPREHVCNFLTSDTEVPELVHTQTRTGAEYRDNQWIRDQNGLLWTCFVTQPNLPLCTEGASMKLDPNLTE